MPPTLASAFMFSTHTTIAAWPIRRRLLRAQVVLEMIDDPDRDQASKIEAATQFAALMPGEDAPEVWCWAVVKHYASGSLQTVPHVELGCVTEAQAKDLARAIDAYKGAYHDRKRWKRDTYSVERREVAGDWIVREDLTGAEYVEARFGTFR